MESYEVLRDKWRALLEQGKAGCSFDLERLAPGGFCLAYSDAGGSMACCSSVVVVGIFDDAKDFLGFLRFAELPRILDYASGDYRAVPNVADSYILGLADETRTKVDWLLGLIDRALRAPMILNSDLSTIFGKFNEALNDTNPSVQILAWGSLVDVLAADHLQEALEEGMLDEVDEDEQPCTELKALLDASEFDENNDEHLALARGFLEQSVTV